MIRFHNVCKSFDNGYEGLRSINFQLEDAEMAFITGHSGAGKSTVLNIIATYENHSRGEVRVANHNLNKITRREIPRLRRQIGYVAQNPQLLLDQTAFANVALPLVVTGTPQEEIGRRARAALDKVGLLSKERMLAAALSTGEQQRLGIARAVVNRPKILLADEPTGNLDPTLASEIMSLFEAFNQIGTSVLIATHDLSLIARMPYRVMTLKDGRMLSTGV